MQVFYLFIKLYENSHPIILCALCMTGSHSDRSAETHDVYTIRLSITHRASWYFGHVKQPISIVINLCPHTPWTHTCHNTK